MKFALHFPARNRCCWLRRPIFYFLFSIFYAYISGAMVAAQSASEDPRATLVKLNALRVEGTEVYRVHELTLRRDAVRIAFDDGKLAFLSALDGRVTGAVFTGEGRIIAVPRDPVEKRSLVRFLGAPLLDQPFSRAYFRFTDNTAEELRTQLARDGRQPFPEASFADEWNPTVANLNPQHSLRILMDLLAREPQAYFYAGIAGDVGGAFEVLVDNRRAEQVRVGQIQFVEGLKYFNTWTSFARSDQPPATPAFEPLAYSIETTISASRTFEGTTLVTTQAARGGERAVALEISRRLTVSEVTDDAGRALAFFPASDVTSEESALRGDTTVLIVLHDAPAAGQTIRMRVKYRGSLPTANDPALIAGALGSWYAHIAGSDKFVPFELSFRWPRTLTLTATGKKAEEHEDGEFRVAKWTPDGAVESVRFSVGGIGWGEAMARGNYRDQWIEDGLSAYRALMTEDSAQPGVLIAQLENFRRELTSTTGENGPLDSIGPLALGYRLHSSKSPRGYARLAKPKSAWVFHMLRMMLREPGKDSDERFEKLLQALANNYRQRALTTADVQKEVEAVMTPEMDLEGTRKTAGRPGAMDWFFDQWVRDTGIPKYSVQFDVKPAGTQYLVRGKLKQSGVPASFLMPVPIYAERAGSTKPVLLGTVVTSGEETPFQFTVRAAPKKLLMDPYHTLLCVAE